MVDDEVPTPSGSSLTLRARDVWDAIDALRNETREARHTQNNAQMRAQSEMEGRLSARISALELMIAAANPTSLGPRINDLERWQSRADADEPGGLPARIAELDRWKDQMSGIVKAIGVLATFTGLMTGFLAILAFVRPPG